MCPPTFYFSPFNKPVRRTFIRWKRIYAFAANRFADAETPSQLQFWRGVMDKCVKQKIVWVARSHKEIRDMIG